MTQSQSKETAWVGTTRSFRLIDLVNADCSLAERVQIEMKLRLVELSLDAWLRQKVAEFEKLASLDPTSPL